MHNLTATLLIQCSDMDITVAKQPFIQHVCSFLICASLVRVCVCVCLHGWWATVTGSVWLRGAPRGPYALQHLAGPRQDLTLAACLPLQFSATDKNPSRTLQKIAKPFPSQKNKKSTKRSPHNARKNPRSSAEHNRLRGLANFVRVNKTGLPRPAGERKTGQK